MKARRTFEALRAEMVAAKAAFATRDTYARVVCCGDAKELARHDTIPATYDELAQVIGFGDLEYLLSYPTTADAPSQPCACPDCQRRLRAEWIAEAHGQTA